MRCVTQGGYEAKENGRSRESYILCFHPRIPPESYRNEKLDISDWGAESEDPNESDEDEDSDKSASDEEAE